MGSWDPDLRHRRCKGTGTLRYGVRAPGQPKPPVGERAVCPGCPDCKAKPEEVRPLPPELTARQAEQLAWIKAWIKRWEVFPTHRVFMAAFDMASTNSATEAFRRLQRKGYLERVKPPGMAPHWRLTGR